MNYELSDALSTVFLRRLDNFLHFKTYVPQNPQKGGVMSLKFPIAQLGFLPHRHAPLRKNCPYQDLHIKNKKVIWRILYDMFLTLLREIFITA